MATTLEEQQVRYWHLLSCFGKRPIFCLCACDLDTNQVIAQVDIPCPSHSEHFDCGWCLEE
jgi:hypothetical protein